MFLYNILYYAFLFILSCIILVHSIETSNQTHIGENQRVINILKQDDAASVDKTTNFPYFYTTETADAACDTSTISLDSTCRTFFRWYSS